MFREQHLRNILSNSFAQSNCNDSLLQFVWRNGEGELVEWSRRLLKLICSIRILASVQNTSLLNLAGRLNKQTVIYDASFDQAEVGLTVLWILISLFITSREYLQIEFRTVCLHRTSWVEHTNPTEQPNALSYHYSYSMKVLRWSPTVLCYFH